MFYDYINHSYSNVYHQYIYLYKYIKLYKILNMQFKAKKRLIKTNINVLYTNLQI